jgi:hypothetical protein
MHRIKDYLCLIFICFSMSAVSQSWSIELRPSLHVPTSELFQQQLRIGNGFELTGTFALEEHMDFYGGLIWRRFDTNDSHDEADIELIQKGVALGALFFFKRKNLQKTSLYVRTGLTIANAVSRSTEESFNVNSRIAAGFDVGMGLKIKSLDGWSLLPELRYSEAAYGYDQNSVKERLPINHIAVSIALSKNF